MPTNISQAIVLKTVVVNVSIEQAFAIFTEKMGRWWPATHHIGGQPFQDILIDPHAGGRWYEKNAVGEDCQWGQVLAWDPPHSVVLSWHLGPDHTGLQTWTFNPDLARASEVEIRFTSEGKDKTRVELEHRALERHGEGHEGLRTAVDSPGGWTAILEQYAKAAEKAGTK